MVGLWNIMQKKKEYVPRDYPEIAKDGVLKIVTSYNSIDYYVSGDTIEGFQYKLCKEVEKQSGLPVEIFLENNLQSCIEGLKEQKYDIIARNIPVTTESRDWLIFSDPISLGKQILVQRTAEYNNGEPPIRNQIRLGKKTVYVPHNSPTLLRLKNLAEEIADTIYVKEEELYDAEQLLYMVAKGDIDYAVIDREIALKNKQHFPQIDIKTDISFTQFQAWALRKDSPVLLDSLNNWLKRAYRENKISFHK
jgi:Predicted soluble lytic transglycosylase fused to an ABC-type amino acid-binding protein